jgi:hypothetical protein
VAPRAAARQPMARVDPEEGISNGRRHRSISFESTQVALFLPRKTYPNLSCACSCSRPTLPRP